MEEKIREWIENRRQEIGIGDSDFSLEELEGGESNHVFRLEAGDNMLVKTMIVRTSRDISDDRITNEARFLELLEEEGIEDVPMKIYYEKDPEIIGQPVLVESFVGEKDLNVQDMTREELDSFARKLAEIHSLDAEIYNRFFEEDEPEEVSMAYELKGNVEEHTENPYRTYREKTDEIDPRVEEFYKRTRNLFEEMLELEGDLPWRITHGDPSNNLRRTDDGVGIVDWELAGPGVPRFELVYMFRHNDMGDEEREEFLDLYRQHRETSDMADRYSEDWEKLLAFNDMIWAAERKEKIKKRGEDNSKYEKMFEKRLEQLEEMWKQS